MGVSVSCWKLAQAVSRLGQLGIVSGTALDQVLVRRLQDGDPGGHICRALSFFPFQKMAERIWKTYYLPGGKKKKDSYVTLELHQQESSRLLKELCIAGNFVEVFLAKEGHQNPVGINYLEKIQIPHLPSLYGALLAGVDYVLMGAGIPLKIPGVLDLLANHEPAVYPLQVTGSRPEDDLLVRLVPKEFMEKELPPLSRPQFLPIISSSTLAEIMIKRSNGKIDGFVIENPSAGGHNAPPRGSIKFNEIGEPIYGERDKIDIEKIKALGLPFWLAGGYGSPEKLREALNLGAAGVQVGTAFAFCEESGLSPDYKKRILQQIHEGKVQVFTDAQASPTGFPFKVARLAGTVSEEEVYAARPRICDLGYLREVYRMEDGSIGFRCAAEPVTVYAAKGGDVEKSRGRKCICNALIATAGHPQIRNGKHLEPGIVTAGDDLNEIKRFFPSHGFSYTAADVLAKLLSS
jgi:nitronate monooxygenase